MCIVALNWSPESATQRLLLIANRDEFFARPSQPLHWWTDRAVLAGKDLQSGGTWLGINPKGRFALVTNVRDPSLRKANAPSRGHLVSDFLTTSVDVKTYTHQIAAQSDRYEGFNLLCGELNPDSQALFFVHSRSATAQRLAAGTYVLSNATLNTPWPKVERLRARFTAALQENEARRETHLFAALADDQQADDTALPQTGLPLDWERRLSAVFIHPENRGGTNDQAYGTRCSSLLSASASGVVNLHERTFDEQGLASNESGFKFTL